MEENTVVAFRNPADFREDPLTDVLRTGARQLLAEAVEAEVSLFLDAHAELVDGAGHRRVVRNGHLPERAIQTGIGPVSVRQPRVRDRGDGAIRFTSAILPRYLRRTRSLEDLLPWLYPSLTEAKEGYAMEENTVVAFRNPADFREDPLTDVLRTGARQLLAEAVEAEVSLFLDAHAELVDGAGHRRVVRNGHLPERAIQTGIGPVSVRQPRVRDRGDGAIRFTSAILPRYLRRTKSLEDILPWLYLKGISTGDFSEALAALLGTQAPGLSASTITRLKEIWGVEMECWQRRDLTAKRYVYFWADGIYFGARMEEEKQCILVVIRATSTGRKELIAITPRLREGRLLAIAKASGPGWRCFSISSVAALKWVRNWRSATARSGSGRRSAKSTRAPASNAAGCTRRATS